MRNADRDRDEVSCTDALRRPTNDRSATMLTRRGDATTLHSTPRQQRCSAGLHDGDVSVLVMHLGRSTRAAARLHIVKAWI